MKSRPYSGADRFARTSFPRLHRRPAPRRRSTGGTGSAGRDAGAQSSRHHLSFSQTHAGARRDVWCLGSGHAPAPPGRSGFIAPSVNASDENSFSGMLEFDQAGNTLRRISPQQHGTTLAPTTDPSAFFAERSLGTSSYPWLLFQHRALHGNSSAYPRCRPGQDHGVSGTERRTRCRRPKSQRSD